MTERSSYAIRLSLLARLSPRSPSSARRPSCFRGTAGKPKPLPMSNAASMPRSIRTWILVPPYLGHAPVAAPGTRIGRAAVQKEQARRQRLRAALVRFENDRQPQPTRLNSRNPGLPAVLPSACASRTWARGPRPRPVRGTPSNALPSKKSRHACSVCVPLHPRRPCASTAASKHRRLNAAFKSYLDSRTTVPRPRPGGGSRDAARPPTALPAKKELARMQRLRAAPVRFEHDRSLSRRG